MVQERPGQLVTASWQLSGAGSDVFKDNGNQAYFLKSVLSTAALHVML